MQILFGLILALFSAFGGFCEESVGRNSVVVDVIRTAPEITRERVIILPPTSDPEREEFEEAGFEQMAAHFRRFGFLVPSFREIRHLLSLHEMPEDRALWYEPVAKHFKATFVVDLQIRRLHHVKKINPAGVLAAGVLLTGIGRYVSAEYALAFYVAEQHRVIRQNAWERRKDYGLGFWQSSRSMAMRQQKETLDALLYRLSQRTLQRPRGYILEPMKTEFPDAKGFR